MAACRRSARIAPQLASKNVITKSVKAEACTPPFEMHRVQGFMRTPITPGSSSKRKLSFEPSTSKPRAAPRLNLADSFTSLPSLVKQEVGDDGDDVKPLGGGSSWNVYGRRKIRETLKAPKEENSDVKKSVHKVTTKRAKHKAGQDVADASGPRMPAKRKEIKKEEKENDGDDDDVVDRMRPGYVKQEVKQEEGLALALVASGGGASSSSPAIVAQETTELVVASGGPFPTFARPSADECYEVRKRLMDLHGLGQYVRPTSCPTNFPVDSRDHPEVLTLEYRPEENLISDIDRSTKVSDLEIQLVKEGGKGEVRVRKTVLDSLVATILSQNTTDNNSRRAFDSLKQAFPTWEEVHEADPKALEDAIRCGGLAETKAKRIVNILDTINKERGLICLEYVRSMTVDEIKAELSRFKGVGPKTVACVLMFHLEENEFPVDTHVFRLSKMLGWVPANADREKTYLHMNKKVPDDIKFDLHCLLVTHGKRCPRCAKGGRAQTAPDGPCPLVNWSPIEALNSAGNMKLLKEDDP